MKKLIKLSDNHYIIVDDSEIKEGDWYYDFTDKEGSLPIYQRSQCPKFYSGCKKITHSTQPLESKFSSIIYRGYGHISLSEVEEAIYGYKNKFLKFFKNEPNYKNYWKPLIEDNPQLIEVHKELVKDKVFTEQDLREAISLAWNYGRVGQNNLKDCGNSIVQSLLPKTEWEVEFDENCKLKLI